MKNINLFRNFLIIHIFTLSSCIQKINQKSFINCGNLGSSWGEYKNYKSAIEKHNLKYMSIFSKQGLTDWWNTGFFAKDEHRKKYIIEMIPKTIKSPKPQPQLGGSPHVTACNNNSVPEQISKKSKKNNSSRQDIGVENIIKNQGTPTINKVQIAKKQKLVGEIEFPKNNFIKSKINNIQVTKVENIIEPTVIETKYIKKETSSNFSEDEKIKENREIPLTNSDQISIKEAIDTHIKKKLGCDFIHKNSKNNSRPSEISAYNDAIGLIEKGIQESNIFGINNMVLYGDAGRGKTTLKEVIIGAFKNNIDGIQKQKNIKVLSLNFEEINEKFKIDTSGVSTVLSLKKKKLQFIMKTLSDIDLVIIEEYQDQNKNSLDDDQIHYHDIISRLYTPFILITNETKENIENSFSSNNVTKAIIQKTKYYEFSGPSFRKKENIESHQMFINRLTKVVTKGIHKNNEEDVYLLYDRGTEASEFNQSFEKFKNSHKKNLVINPYEDQIKKLINECSNSTCVNKILVVNNKKGIENMLNFLNDYDNPNNWKKIMDAKIMVIVERVTAEDNELFKFYLNIRKKDQGNDGIQKGKDDRRKRIHTIMNGKECQVWEIINNSSELSR